MANRMIFAIACAFISGCAPAAFPMDELVGFENPQACEPNEAFSSLLSGLVSMEVAGDTYVPTLQTPPIPTRFKDWVGTPVLKFDGQEYRATLPLKGTWHGLPLRSVVVVGWIESEQGFELLFDADPEQVLASANRAGFDIPSSGSEYRNGDVLGLNVGVAKRESSAALFCIPG